MRKIGAIPLALLFIAALLIVASLYTNNNNNKAPQKLSNTPSVQFEKPFALQQIFKGECGGFVQLNLDTDQYIIYRTGRAEAYYKSLVNVDPHVNGQPTITYHANGQVTIKIQQSQAPCLRQKFATHSADDPGNDPSYVMPRQ